MRDHILGLIQDYRRKRLFTPAEAAVLEIIQYGTKAHPTSQAQIARSAPWLGVAQKYEGNSLDSSTRRIREIIRELRLKYGILIISGAKGSYIAETKQDVVDYLDSQRKIASANFRSYMISYFLMGRYLNLNEMPLFENEIKQHMLDEVLDPTYNLIIQLSKTERKPRPGVPLNMRIGDKPLQFLEGKQVRDSITGEEWTIRQALYTGCYVFKTNAPDACENCGADEFEHGDESDSGRCNYFQRKDDATFGWNETGPWEICP